MLLLSAQLGLVPAVTHVPPSPSALCWRSQGGSCRVISSSQQQQLIVSAPKQIPAIDGNTSPSSFLLLPSSPWLESHLSQVGGLQHDVLGRVPRALHAPRLQSGVRNSSSYLLPQEQR